MDSFSLATTVEKGTILSSSRLRHLKENITSIQQNAEIGVKYMQAWEEKILERNEALEEGRAVGLQEGEAIGLQKGKISAIEDTIRSLRSFDIAEDAIAKELSTRFRLSADDISSLMKTTK